MMIVVRVLTTKTNVFVVVAMLENAHVQITPEGGIFTPCFSTWRNFILDSLCKRGLFVRPEYLENITVVKVRDI